MRRTGRGRFVVIRGRRRVGKSRLVSEFLLRHRVPSVFYAATPSGPDRELGRFTEAIGRSSLAAAALVRSGTSFGSIGAYWTRTNDVEVDLVGTPNARPAGRVSMVGSVKWRETAPFGRADVAALHHHRDRVPGADANSLLVAVTRTAAPVEGIDAMFGPADLVDAWR